MRLLLPTVLLSLVLGCGSAPLEQVTDFSATFPKNYLIVHYGAPQQFCSARCYQYSTVDDLSAPNAGERLTSMLAERLPQLPPCKQEWPRIVIKYRAGRGVSLHHADADGSLPYSAFAFVALQNSIETAKTARQADALAEWQYWRGGSSQLTMQQFVFDFTNLYVNAVVKPIPRA